MYKNTILYCYLFGSIYLFSTSLLVINMSLLQNKKIPNKLCIINGLTFFVFGSLVACNTIKTMKTIKQ